MAKFLQSALLYTKDSSSKDVTLQVKHFHIFTLFDWEFSVTKILERFRVPSTTMPINRAQVAFCFKQATQAGRFSEEYCIDRILELLNKEDKNATQTHRL